jgi:hypothetical protein
MVPRSLERVIMARSRTGEAISPGRRTAGAQKKLREFVTAAKGRGDLDAWCRGRATLGYIEGRRVVELAAELDVTRGSVNRWLQWYEALGVDGLLTGTAPGPAPKLTAEMPATYIVDEPPLPATPCGHGIVVSSAAAKPPSRTENGFDAPTRPMEQEPVQACRTRSTQGIARRPPVA